MSSVGRNPPMRDMTVPYRYLMLPAYRTIRLYNNWPAPNIYTQRKELSLTKVRTTSSVRTTVQKSHLAVRS